MLRSRTPGEWVDVALADLDALLIDHAHCEKKAAASALALIAAYPHLDELVERMSALAAEEVRHFRGVYERMRARGLSLRRDKGDPYVRRVLALARADSGRLVDQLLLFGLIEARSRERLELLAEGIEEPVLARFYRRLANAEARHAHVFFDLALFYEKEDVVRARLKTLAEAEAEIVAGLPLLPRVH